MPATLYLILLTYVRPPEEVAAHLEEHRAYLRGAIAAGHLIVSGRMMNDAGGVILVRAASEEAVRALVADDPFGQHGIATHQIIPFAANWSAPAFAPFLAPFAADAKGQSKPGAGG
ncbi:MAG TPA: YciI family protein [Ktedonobacterales bacterium]|jgi:uncharacterized protein YciI|nr:YciI family protein [Ktedonobacterales bacterium]